MQVSKQVLCIQKKIELEELGMYFFQLDNLGDVSNQYRCLFFAFRQSDYFLCNIPGSIWARQCLDVLRQTQQLFAILDGIYRLGNQCVFCFGVGYIECRTLVHQGQNSEILPAPALETTRSAAA